MKCDRAQRCHPSELCRHSLLHLALFIFCKYTVIS
jgi:hypothetical protein